MNRTFRKAMFVLVVVLILGGIHLFIRTQNVDLKYNTTDLKTKLAELKSKNRQLGISVAKKKQLSYIEKFAREKLNMVYPKKMNYIIESEDR